MQIYAILEYNSVNMHAVYAGIPEKADKADFCREIV